MASGKTTPPASTPTDVRSAGSTAFEEDMSFVSMEELTTRAVRAHGAGKPQAAWRLIWCHEKCFKDEEKGVRTTVTETADAAGGHLTCVKKATTFETKYLPGLGPRLAPYVLLTDGREIKPCIQALAEHGVEHRPFLIVALLENSKHAARVSWWFRGSSMPNVSDRFRIIADPSQLGSVIADALRDQRGGAARPQPASPSPPPPQETSFPVGVCAPWPKEATRRAQWAPAGTRLAACDSGDATRDHLARQACRQWPAGRIVSPQHLCSMDATRLNAFCVPGQIVQVLTPVVTNTPKQLESMLVAAMPLNYED